MVILDLIVQDGDMIGLFTKSMDNTWFGVACDENRIYATTFAKSREKVLSILCDRLPFGTPFKAFKKPSPFAERAILAIKSSYDGKAECEDFQLATEYLSEYKRKVLEVCAQIPLGYVASYGDVAKAAGGSPRSVGGVMANNPFAPIIPCHRVVKSDFSLGGYGKGTEMKLELLTREKRGRISGRDILIDEKKLGVHPTEIVLNKLKKRKPTEKCCV